MEPIPRATRSLPFKIDAVPPEYLDSRVVGCWVEVLSLGRLDLDSEKDSECTLLQKMCKNHVILRFLFRYPTPDLEPTVKGQHIEGVKVSIEAFEDPNVKHPEIGSNLVVKFLDYSGPNLSVLKTIEVPMNGNSVKFGQVLGLAVTGRLEDFVFVHNGHDYTGCRDWISQFLRLLEIRGLINTRTQGESVFQSLNYVYNGNEKRFFKAVEKGRFLSHKRVHIKELIYSS